MTEILQTHRTIAMANLPLDAEIRDRGRGRELLERDLFFAADGVGRQRDGERSERGEAGARICGQLATAFPYRKSDRGPSPSCRAPVERG
ncbi:hypothetical protein EWE75_15670 [Sphingomonas populi]|uniref:Uncharacterized protein n=1 Tax=Sphingomonas populi TaxID=2484750 RepID=A0A4Q6Y006_9SPHN|nr:hypothetical protein EWE75_15670 [Sphingomonas populi]